MVVSKVTYIKVGADWEDYDICVVYLENGDLLYLWWDRYYPRVNRDRQNLWISMLRDSMVNGLEVELLTDEDDDSLVQTVKTFAP
ncbi:MAG: hypothetical protein ACFFEV_10150 [Candidatus Thorarchaeota archaeon]